MDNGEHEAPLHNLGSAAQPGRSSGPRTGALSIGSGNVQVTVDAFRPSLSPAASASRVT